MSDNSLHDGKKELLIKLAEMGYNVGFGAKKNLASYDITSKAPLVITIISLGVGVFSLVFDALSTKHIAASITFLGILGMYLEIYKSNSSKYMDNGIALTKVFYKVRGIYSKAKNINDANDLVELELEYEQAQLDYFSIPVVDQVIFSNWYAHYKFFWEMQIEWVDEQKKFRFFRDKAPLSLRLVFLSLFVLVVIIGFLAWLSKVGSCNAI